MKLVLSEAKEFPLPKPQGEGRGGGEREAVNQQDGNLSHHRGTADLESAKLTVANFILPVKQISQQAGFVAARAGDPSCACIP